MQALNDLCKVKLETDEYGYGTTDKETAESGILVEIPDTFHFFGYWSFAFENSFMNKEALKEIHAYWKTKIGRRVYWTALSERGNILEKDGEKFAFIKFTSLIAEDDADSTARSTHENGGGSFGVEK